jgi:hypothetical protein
MSIKLVNYLIVRTFCFEVEYKKWDTIAMRNQLIIDLSFGLWGTFFAVFVVRPFYNAVAYFDGWTDDIHCPRWEWVYIGSGLFVTGATEESKVLCIDNY